jgi:hypothetical protein
LATHIKNLQSTILTHVGDTNIHITTEERKNWNSTQTQSSNHISNAGIHVTSEEKAKWNAKSGFSGAYTDLTGAPKISQDNTGNFTFIDTSGNTAAQLTAAGALYIAYLYVSGEKINILERIVTGETTVSTHIADTIKHITATERENWNQIVAHLPDAVRHITDEERALWNAKSTFSGNYLDLLNKPEITRDDDDDTLIISDNSGNKIFQVGADGAHVFNLYIKGEGSNSDISIKEALAEKAPATHTHLYAGSATAGGPADSAM